MKAAGDIFYQELTVGGYTLIHSCKAGKGMDPSGLGTVVLHAARRSGRDRPNMGG